MRVGDADWFNHQDEMAEPLNRTVPGAVAEGLEELEVVATDPPVLDPDTDVDVACVVCSAQPDAFLTPRFVDRLITYLVRVLWCFLCDLSFERFFGFGGRPPAGG